MRSAPDPVPDWARELADSIPGRLLAADRRPVGQPWPTVPVPGAPEGVGELDEVRTATALFEMCSDQLGTTPEVLPTDTLTAALTGAVRALGPDGLTQEAVLFADLPQDEEEELPGVAACWWLARRLVLTFWYEGARSRPMTAGEVAACLYRSDAAWAWNGDVLDTSTEELSDALSAGLDGQSAPSVIAAGKSLGRLLRPAHLRPVTEEFPDLERARTCLFLAVHHTPALPAPLVVRPDPGSRLGTQPLLGTWAQSPAALYGQRPRAWHW